MGRDHLLHCTALHCAHLTRSPNFNFTPHLKMIVSRPSLFPFSSVALDLPPPLSRSQHSVRFSSIPISSDLRLGLWSNKNSRAASLTRTTGWGTRRLLFSWCPRMTSSICLLERGLKRGRIRVTTLTSRLIQADNRVAIRMEEKRREVSVISCGIIAG